MIDESVLYATVVRCSECGEIATYAHLGPKTPIDQDAPWPDVDYCPLCAHPYDTDLGAQIETVRELGRSMGVQEDAS